jgi:phosphonate transport system permease protein
VISKMGSVAGLAEATASSGQRRWILFAIVASGIWASITLNLYPALLVPGQGGLAVVADFFSYALSPATTYQSIVPEGTTPLAIQALLAAWHTVQFAAAAMGLSLIGGISLGFLSSYSLMIETRRGITRVIGGTIYAVARLTITLMRSIHELLWAVLFLAAFGISQLGAVIALALPCAGILAKIFSELIDETPRHAAHAAAAAGASPIQIYCFILAPQALPNILAYSFYRFECALRSSAVLGFFGYPTLGFYIAASFENLYYGEVWVYLYTLFLLVAAVDLWSGAIRKRLA